MFGEHEGGASVEICKAVAEAKSSSFCGVFVHNTDGKSCESLVLLRDVRRAPMPPKKVDGAKIGALIAVIGDEETVTGMLLAGVGDKERGGRSNFMVVDPSKTTPAQIQEAFHNFTKRPDVAVLVINQYIASTIRETVDSFEGKSPAILEIPSKEHPYDPSQDAVHRRTKLLLGIRD
jgi:V-type H+-transporting ATPase subunit F